MDKPALFGRNPFSRSVDLRPDALNVLRELVRQIKAMDEITDDRPLKRLDPHDLQSLWESDVVVTITNAQLPASLAALARECLAGALDALIHAVEYERRETQKLAAAYEGNATFGLF